jgi:uncharacterized Zn-binding protein involved in type VI secretion
MGTPAAKMMDQIQGICATHQIPNPAALGAPTPGPPFPFSAPITTGCCPTVLINGQPAAVMGSSGMCTPPHVGLHLTDPFFAPPTQVGTIIQGSPTVLFGGAPAARTGSQATLCAPNMGSVLGTAATVLIA